MARDRHGIGQRVETNLYQATLNAMAQESLAVMNQGITLERSAAGIASSWNDVPYGPHPSSDGWVAIAMCPLGKLADLLDDPELAGMDPWLQRDEAKLKIDESTSKLTSAALMTLLRGADVWCAPVRSSNEALEDAKAREPHRLVEMDHPRAGRITAIANPIEMSKTPSLCDGHRHRWANIPTK